jgi:endonuclease/exonuclease/phosphatase family metal-dependent hydrolase
MTFAACAALAFALPARGQACLDAASPVQWTSLAPPEERAELDTWCDSVGPPVVVTSAGGSKPLSALVLVTWNVHVGGGHVDRLLRWLERQPDLNGRPYGLVLLLEETFRSGSAIGGSYPAGLDVPKAIRPRRPSADIAELAATLSMHAAYIPSMRNGVGLAVAEREDRGNAILSTEPLASVQAIELPLGKQRRVAVGATIDLGGAGPIRVVAIHLDTGGRRERQAAAFARYLGGLDRGIPTVVGGDLNTLFGRRERTFKVLDTSLPVEDCGGGKTNKWPWRLDIPFGWWRGRIDFVFTDLAGFERHRRCDTVRDFFGSDHRPVVMIVPLPSIDRVSRGP